MKLLGVGGSAAASLVLGSHLGLDLLLGLVVAVRDQSVEEAVGTTLVVALGLCALDLAVQVSCSLLVDVVLVVVVVVVVLVCDDVSTWELQAAQLVRRERGGWHTALVVHGQLALDLLSDVGGHVCGVVAAL